MSYKKIAICISGDPKFAIDTLSTYNSYFFFYGKLDADIFIHTWDVEGAEFIDKIKTFYNPKSILVETCKFTNTIESDLYSMMMSNQLKKQQEKENNKKYELVIKHSFNVLYKNNTTFSTPTVEERHLYFLNLIDGVSYMEHHGIENSGFWGDSETMDIVLDSYFYYKQYIKIYECLYENNFYIDHDMFESYVTLEQILYKNLIFKNIHPREVTQRNNLPLPSIIKDISDINETKKIKTLLVIGDSWSFGSEIKDPSLPENMYDWLSENDAYRIPKIYPTKLSKKLNVDNLVNISYPAISNDTIVRMTINWLTKEYIAKGEDIEKLFVIVQLSSPERKDFVFEDYNLKAQWQTIWPLWKHNYGNENLNKFVDLYAPHFLCEEEYISRYINQIFYLENFFKLYNIKYIIYQGFYQYIGEGIRTWIDNPYINRLHYEEYVRYKYDQNENFIWNLIDEVRFVDKNRIPHSFHNHVINKEIEEKRQDGMLMMHPSELGHTWWADYLYDYIEKYNLLTLNPKIKINYRN